MHDLTLGLDIGTTTVSAVVADISSENVLASRTLRHNADLPASDPAAKCQSPEVLEKTSRQLLEKCLSLFPNITAIGITGQMHGILYLDGSGIPVSPLYTWQDQRSAALCPGLKTLTGYPVSPGYGLATHCALMKAGAVPKTARKLCTIMDYLAFSLCGKQNLMTHATNAASLGFFRMEAGCFDPDALRKAGIAPDLLPPVTKKAALCGYFRDIPVVVPIGDNQASFLGSVPDPHTMALANFGTGSQISRMIPEIPEADPGIGIEVRPFLEDTYLMAGSALCGGRAYALLERFFRSFYSCEEDQYHRLNALALKGLELKTLPEITTTFCGTRSDPQASGSIRGLTEQTLTPEAFAAGTLMGMARELHTMFTAMPGKPVSALVASGNAVRKNPALVKALERVFGTKVLLPPCPEEAAFGAACFAASAKLP